jgi:DNA polymerase I
MQEAYKSGDFYFAFAVLAGALSKDDDAEDKIIKVIRNQYKQCCLAILYGQEAHGLAVRTKLSWIRSQRLIDQHKDKFPIFWKWSKRTVSQTMCLSKMWTSLGWPLHIQEGVLNLPDTDERKKKALKKKGSYPNLRSLANFQTQAHGSDILRVACINAMDGLAISATVHDAIMILAPENDWARHRDLLVDGMKEASREVLGGFEIGVDVKVIMPGEHYRDDKGRGDDMWNTVRKLLK